MPSTIKITNRDLLKLDSGLKSLDGLRKGDVIEWYNFDDSTKWNIARDIVAVERALLPYQKAVRLAMARHGVAEGEKLTADNALKISAFSAEVEPMRDAVVDVDGILVLKRESLMVSPDTKKRNPIPASVFGTLIPLLEPESTE